MPSESETWRYAALPPLEQLGNSQAALLYDLIGVTAGKRVQVTAPEQLVAPGAKAERPSNVLSIDDFVRANPNRVRKEVS